MKLLPFAEFVLCPPGTIDSEYRPCIISSTCRLEEVLKDFSGNAIDFIYTEVGASVYIGSTPEDTLCRDEKSDCSIVIGDSSRWGMFDWDARYLVYEPADIAKMIELLTGGLYERR